MLTTRSGRTQRSVAGLLALAALALAGCSDSTPNAVSSTAVAITTLQFSGSDVNALDADEQSIDAVTFAEGATAVVELVSDVLEIAPTVTENEEQCAGANTQYSWDGLTVVQWAGTTDFTTSFTAASIGDVRLEATGGYAIGDDVSAFAANPSTQSSKAPNTDDLFVAFDPVSTVTREGYTSPIGAIGYLPDGSVLASVITPGEWSSFLC